MPRKTYRRAAVLLGLAAALAGCGGNKKADDPVFKYDKKRPLGLVQLQAQRQEGVEVRDVRFLSPSGERIAGYLVVPAGRGPHPAVVYAHGAGGSRADLLPRAIEVAKLGAVAFAPDTPFAQLRAAPIPQGLQGVRALVATEVAAVVEARRAVDLLRSLPEVDGDRVAYVGWSAGARTGAMLAGVEHRIRAFDLLAGGSAPVSDFTSRVSPEVRPEVERLMTQIDPLRLVREHRDAELLFQDGRHDELIPRPALIGLANAAGGHTEVRWYDSGHTPSERAWADSRRWLARRLGLA